MYTKTLAAVGAGVFMGVLLSVALMFSFAPRVMITESISQYDYDETIERLVNTAENAGWSIPKVHNLQKAVKKAGYEVKPTRVLELCKPEHAGKILADNDSKIVSSMMPCRVSVYENDGGQVIISRMNTSLMSSLFNQNISSVMAEASHETEQLLEEVIK